MTTPYLTIDLRKIQHNARVIVELCGRYGIEVTGVTKAACGHPGIAWAMLRGGVVSIADSRFENIRRMKDAGVDTSFMLLRLPPLSRVDETVVAVDISLSSELAVLEALSAVAVRRGQVHDVILMVDLGDLREGIWPDDLISIARQAAKLPAIRVAGLGANLACLAGVIPSEENMERLVALAEEVEHITGTTLRWISGINSSGLDLIAAGQMPRRVNHARIGEAILLGRETTRRRPWPGTRQDAFRLYAEVLELKKKPSMPTGERGEDAFGHYPVFEDRGETLAGASQSRATKTWTWRASRPSILACGSSAHRAATSWWTSPTPKGPCAWVTSWPSTSTTAPCSPPCRPRMWRSVSSDKVARPPRTSGSVQQGDPVHYRQLRPGFQMGLAPDVGGGDQLRRTGLEVLELVGLRSRLESSG